MFSRTTLLRSDVLVACPLALARADHERCGCKRRVMVGDLRVLACCFPNKWNGTRIARPDLYAEAIRRVRLASNEEVVVARAKTTQARPPEGSESRPARGPLWPQPIPVIGLTGEYASGKTLFGLSIAGGPETLVYDTEKSSESYQALGFDRIDVPAEMLRQFGGKHKPVDTFVWWREHVRTLQPGRYRVVQVDTISEIESGIFDYVFAHPEEFGRTRAQYLKSSALAWGDVKELWKQVLSDLASRCETFVFCAHLRQVWAGNAPTAKKAPKGKSTLEELASLYLWMERKPDLKGNVPVLPSAIVRKSRLAHIVRDPKTGGMLVAPALPPRLPVATPDAIREYQRTPPDYGSLAEGERAPEEVLSEDERAELRARAAEAEAETERLKLERLDRQERAGSKQQPPRPKAALPAAVVPVAATAPPPGTNGARPSSAQPPLARATPMLADDGEAIADEQLDRLAELRDELFERYTPDDPAEMWAGILARRGVKSARELTAQQGDELIAALCGAISDLERIEGDEEGATAAAEGPATEDFPAAGD